MTLLGKEPWMREAVGESYEKLLSLMRKNPRDPHLAEQLYRQALRIGKLQEIASNAPEIFLAWAPQHSKDLEWQQAFQGNLLKWDPDKSFELLKEYQPYVQELLPSLYYRMRRWERDEDGNNHAQYVNLELEPIEDPVRPWKKLDPLSLALWARKNGLTYQEGLIQRLEGDSSPRGRGSAKQLALLVNPSGVGSRYLPYKELLQKWVSLP